MLSKVVTDNQKDWNDHVQNVLLKHRTVIHESTGYTPFLVMFGHSPSSTAKEETATVYKQNVKRSLKDTFSSVCQQLDPAHQRQNFQQTSQVQERANFRYEI